MHNELENLKKELKQLEFALSNTVDPINVVHLEGQMITIKNKIHKLMNKKEETKEITGASSAGAYSGKAFTNIVRRKINSIPNSDMTEDEVKEGEFTEATDASSSGAFDVPAFGKTTKGGRKNPLKIDGPNSIYKTRAVTDKNFPKWGGPDSYFVKVKEKCKKFPYCNQGNTGALEFIKEDVELQKIIKEESINLGIPYKELEKLVLNEIKQIFI